nr:CPBP family intramembrane glutamic endopeptidase [Escherichia coli]
MILTLLTIFILAPLNEERLFRGIMLNVFRSRYCWTMWLGALITSLLFVAAHSQYQNQLTLAELFLVGLRPGSEVVACYCRYCCIWKQPRWVYCLVESYIFIKHCALKSGVFFSGCYI